MRKLLLALAFAAGSTAVGSAGAEVYPSRPIKLIVPFSAGSVTDITTRIVGERMRASLGQPVIAENVAGAGGTIGVARVVRAAPDGYTIGIGQWTSHVGSGAIYPLQFDLLKDLEPVTMLSIAPLWIIGKKTLPANDMKELIAAQGEPGQGVGRDDRRGQRHPHVPRLFSKPDRHPPEEAGEFPGGNGRDPLPGTLAPD